MDRLFTPPEWSEEHLKYLDEHMSSLNREDVIIYHVGANTGQELEQFFNFFNSGKIYCFEANPTCIHLLEENLNEIKSSHSNQNIEVEIINAAVCNKNGKVTLYRNSEMFGDAHQSATIMPKHEPHALKRRDVHHEEKVEVNAITLNSFSKERKISHVDLIWADVEGAQGELLIGASDILTSVDYIFIEHSPLWGGWSKFEIHEYLDNDFLHIATIAQDIIFKNKNTKKIKQFIKNYKG